MEGWGNCRTGMFRNIIPITLITSGPEHDARNLNVVLEAVSCQAVGRWLNRATSVPELRIVLREFTTIGLKMKRFVKSAQPIGEEFLTKRVSTLLRFLNFTFSKVE